VKIFSGSLISLIMFVSTHSFSADKVNIPHKEIMEVVESFRVAIIEKDEAKFVNQFYDKSIPWLGVAAEKRKGILPSESGIDHGGHMGFITWVVSSNERMEEKFWDVNIETNGDIASVYFKYSFHIGDYKSNWGDESWHLIMVVLI
jgi:hypothetical protein